MSSTSGPFPCRAALALFFAPELRAWRGEMALPVVFWGYGVAASTVLLALHASAMVNNELLLQQALIFASLGYTGWILVAIWRCAPNAPPFWGGLARWLTVAWGLNSGLVLFFVQFALLIRYVGG
jgi:hypothetical protein